MSNIEQFPAEDAQAAELPSAGSSSQPSKSFSLSAMFLLMVTAASLFGFVREALPGVNSSIKEGSSQSSPDFWYESMRKLSASAVLLIIGLIIGSRRGWKLLHKKSGVLIGIFFAVLAVVTAGLILIAPPKWPMIVLCCVLLIISGYLFRLGQARPSPLAEPETPE